MFGSGELILIMGALLLLFGGKKLPEFAKNLGKGIREFKRACNGETEEEEVVPVKETKHIAPSDDTNEKPH